MISFYLAAAVHVALPEAQRVAIRGHDVIAVAANGKGAIISNGRIARTFEAGDNPVSIALLGDGFVIAHHERKYVTVHRPPAFAPVQIPVAVTPHAHFAAVGDLDGDGEPDIAVNDMGGRRVVVLWGPDFRQSTAVATGSKGFAYENVAIAGQRLYVPCWPQPEVAVLRADKRVLTQERMIELPNPAFFVSADAAAVVTYSGSIMDGSRDGLVLLDGMKRLDAGKAPVRVASYQGTLAAAALGGTVKFGAETLQFSHPEDVALGDLDGDGKTDLAVASSAGEVILVLSR